MNNLNRGLYNKFEVSRVDGSSEPGGKHYGCEYFVLDLTHDKHALAMLRAYADSCEVKYPLLAADLRALANADNDEAATAPKPDTGEGKKVISRETKRWRCRDCDHISTGAELLRAPSPFDPRDLMTGCPECRTTGPFEEICDEPGCDELACCGWPAGPEFGGYRRVSRLSCWWYGCTGHPQDPSPPEHLECVRCGDIVGYGDLVGDTRHARFRDWCRRWSVRRLCPKPCSYCGHRFKHDDSVDHIPF